MSPRLLRSHSCVLLEQQLLSILGKLSNPSACLKSIPPSSQQVQRNLSCLGGTQNFPQWPGSFLTSVLSLYLQLCLTKSFCNEHKNTWIIAMTCSDCTHTNASQHYFVPLSKRKLWQDVIKQFSELILPPELPHHSSQSSPRQGSAQSHQEVHTPLLPSTSDSCWDEFFKWLQRSKTSLVESL